MSSTSTPTLLSIELHTELPMNGKGTLIKQWSPRSSKKKSLCIEFLHGKCNNAMCGNAHDQKDLEGDYDPLLIPSIIPDFHVLDRDNYIAASIDALLDRLLDDNKLDLDFRKAFLFTFPYFTTAVDLIARIAIKYQTAMPGDKQKVTKLKTLGVLRDWLKSDHSFVDIFDNPVASASLIAFLTNIIENEPSLKTYALPLVVSTLV